MTSKSGRPCGRSGPRPLEPSSWSRTPAATPVRPKLPTRPRRLHRPPRPWPVPASPRPVSPAPRASSPRPSCARRRPATSGGSPLSVTLGRQFLARALSARSPRPHLRCPRPSPRRRRWPCRRGPRRSAAASAPCRGSPAKDPWPTRARLPLRDRPPGRPARVPPAPRRRRSARRSACPSPAAPWKPGRAFAWQRPASSSARPAPARPFPLSSVRTAWTWRPAP
mmetsp:Transcript_74521/g.146275  ORF Transcript_74521/g.146275 Transcript_74521/m.146275 type:complete len:224 (-) Transcript_74521:112-783(-)